MGASCWNLLGISFDILDLDDHPLSSLLLREDGSCGVSGPGFEQVGVAGLGESQDAQTLAAGSGGLVYCCPGCLEVGSLLLQLAYLIVFTGLFLKRREASGRNAFVDDSAAGDRVQAAGSVEGCDGPIALGPEFYESVVDFSRYGPGGGFGPAESHVVDE